MGRNHSTDDYPILLVGKMGGYLKPGMHYRSNSAENVAKISYTMAQGMGVNLPSFGVGEGEVNSIVSEVVA